MSKASAIMRTERLLKDYRYYVSSRRRDKLAEDKVQAVKEALYLLRDDEYADILDMYVSGVSGHKIAARTHYDVSTVYRQIKRLTRAMACLLYPDECLRED